MAWQDEMVPMLRALINDMVSPYTYSDNRLEEVIVVAAQLSMTDIDFDKDYTVTVSATSISPDPTDSQKDEAFINLVSLKAACFVLSNEAKLAAKESFSVSDGPSSVSTGGRMTGSIALAKEMCNNYKMAKVEYLAGNSRAGQAILTPYTTLNVPSSDNFT